MSLRAGASGDEASHHQQAKYVYDYYASFGKDTMALTPRASANKPAKMIAIYPNKLFTICLTAYSSDIENTLAIK